MFLIKIIILFLIILIIYYIIPFILARVYKIRFTTTLKNKDCIYITFDDGPDPISTPEILNILDKYNIKATFFLLGKNMEKYPDIVKMIINKGHKIGDHSFNHLHPWKSNPISYYKDLYRTNKILEQFSITTKLYRPPYGKLNFITLMYIIIFNKKFVGWTLDPKDYKCKTSNEIIDYVMNSILPGDVLLLHDSRISDSLNSAEITVKALERIIDNTNNKIHFSALNEQLLIN